MILPLRAKAFPTITKTYFLFSHMQQRPHEGHVVVTQANRANPSSQPHPARETQRESSLKQREKHDNAVNVAATVLSRGCLDSSRLKDIPISSTEYQEMVLQGKFKNHTSHMGFMRLGPFNFLFKRGHRGSSVRILSCSQHNRS